MSETLKNLLAPYAARVESELAERLVEPGVPEELAEAMRYGAWGGKRIRGAMALMAAEVSGATGGDDLVARAAVAVELIHAYSLVHDDLPSMDDDALRRGRPTVHVRFGEAMAILAGDALLTRAFGLLGESDDPPTARLVAELAGAAGAAGMVAGQVADMELSAIPDGPGGAVWIHLRKTAAMFRAAARMGAIAVGAPRKTVDALGEYAETLGLAFQFFDDLLDTTATAEQLGKTPGKDARSGKRTPLDDLGPDGARRRGEELTAQSIAALDKLGPAGDNLRQLARMLCGRKS